MAKADALPDNIAKYFEQAISEGNRSGIIRKLPYDHEILMENLFDPAHLPFAHHGSLPSLKRSNGGVIPMIPVPAVFPNAIASAEFEDSPTGDARTAVVDFVDPALCALSVQSKDSRRSDRMTLFLTSPLRRGASRLLISVVFEGALSGHEPKMSFLLKLIFTTPAINHMANNSVLDGDSILLHIQEQNLRKERKSGWTPDTYFTPTSSDYMIVRFRNWLRKEGGGGPFGPLETQEASSISRRELLDRYKTYTLQNKKGQKALAFVNTSIAAFKILSNAFLLMGGATVVYSMQKGIGFMWQTVVCLSAFALFSFLERFVRNKILPLFYFVDYVHADKN